MKYEISRGTLAIVPEDEKRSRIYEDDEEYVVDQTPFQVMEESCKYFGSTYEGRRKSAKEILGAEYKIPILVEDGHNLIVFPTNSPGVSNCAWIFLRHVKNIEKIDLDTTKIIFDNGQEISVPTSYRSIENQISRAARLDFIMRKRKEF